jgi:histidinol-phosphate aminotransferase
MTAFRASAAVTAGIDRATGRPPSPRGTWPPPVAHGGPDRSELARLGLDPDCVIDFSVNGNPLGASPRALRALASVDPTPYPEPRAARLREALAGVHGVAPDEVLVGNGSVELIWLLAAIYLGPGDRALVVGPTFGEYEAAVVRQGAAVVSVIASAAEGFELSTERLVEAVRSTRPRVLFFCRPNNPTGRALAPEALARVLDVAGDALVVVDEAYVDLSEGVESLLTTSRSGSGRDSRLVVLRSMTKDFGLAGLRLGYLVAAGEVVEAVARAQPPWSVNALAQAAGQAALEDPAHVVAGRRLARRAMTYLSEGLGRLGLRCLPSSTGFGLVEVGDGAAMRRRLLEHGVLVRDCASFGLPAYIRVGARPLPECDRLLRAMTDVL